MNDEFARYPHLDRLYQSFLSDEDSAKFICDVSSVYTIETLLRLAECGQRVSRRAAVMAIGLIADYRANHTLGRAMQDNDRAVRLLAENGIRNVWMRVGSEKQRQDLGIICRLIQAEQFLEAVECATDMIRTSPYIAEAWNQRAVAYFNMGRFSESASDCHQTLEINPYHFGAAVGMAHCYLELNNAVAALESFRRALKLNPDLEGVRAQIEYLQRTLEEK